MAKGKENSETSRAGITAVELLVVLSVLLLLLLFAWPRLSAWRAYNLRVALRIAVTADNRDETIRLLRRGASPDGWSGSTPHYCLRCRVVSRNDLEMAIHVFPPAHAGGTTVPWHSPPLLNLAVSENSPEMVGILLDAGANLEHRARYGIAKSTGIMMRDGQVSLSSLVAAYETAGHPLVPRKSQPNRHDSAVGTHRILSPKELQRVETGVVTGDPVALEQRPRFVVTTLLHDAVVLNSESILQQLLRRGVDPNLTDEGGITAWQLATQLGRERLAAILRDAGAQTDIVFTPPGTNTD